MLESVCAKDPNYKMCNIQGPHRLSGLIIYESTYSDILFDLTRETQNIIVDMVMLCPDPTSGPTDPQLFNSKGLLCLHYIHSLLRFLNVQFIKSLPIRCIN